MFLQNHDPVDRIRLQLLHTLRRLSVKPHSLLKHVLYFSKGMAFVLFLEEVACPHLVSELKVRGASRLASFMRQL